MSRIWFGLFVLLGNLVPFAWCGDIARADGCILRYSHAATSMYSAYSGTESFASCSACQQKVAELRAKYRGFSGTCTLSGSGTGGSSVPSGGTWQQQVAAGLANSFLQGFAEGMNQPKDSGPSPAEVAAREQAAREEAARRAAAEKARREAEERETQRRQSLAGWNKVQEEEKNARSAVAKRNQEEGAQLLTAITGEAPTLSDTAGDRSSLTLALLEPAGTTRGPQPTRYEAVEERQTYDFLKAAEGRPEAAGKGAGPAGGKGDASALSQLQTLAGESRQAAAAANDGALEDAKAKLDAAWDSGQGKTNLPTVPSKKPGKQKTGSTKAASPVKSKVTAEAPPPAPKVSDQSEGAKLLALMESSPASASPVPSTPDRSSSGLPKPQGSLPSPADPCLSLQKDLERLGADAERLKKNLSLMNRYVLSAKSQFNQWAEGADQALRDIDDSKNKVIGDCLIGLSSLRLGDHLAAMEKAQADELGKITDTIITAKGEDPLRVGRLRAAQQMARENLKRIRDRQAALTAQDAAVFASDMDAVYSKGGQYIISAEGLKEQIINASVAVLSLDTFKKYSNAVNPFVKWWNTMKCGEDLIDLVSSLSLHLLDVQASRELAKNQDVYLKAMAEQGRKLKDDIDQIKKINGQILQSCRPQAPPLGADNPVTGRK